MKRELENELYIPPQIWVMMKSQGLLQAAEDEATNLWLELSIANVQATLMLFVYERKQFLKGRRE